MDTRGQLGALEASERSVEIDCHVGDYVALAKGAVDLGLLIKRELVGALGGLVELARLGPGFSEGGSGRGFVSQLHPLANLSEAYEAVQAALVHVT